MCDIILATISSPTFIAFFGPFISILQINYISNMMRLQLHLSEGVCKKEMGILLGPSTQRRLEFAENLFSVYRQFYS